MELIQEIKEKNNALDVAITVLKSRGKEYAQAEHDYRVALSKRIMILRAEGMPVTILTDVVRGEDNIADLRMARDIAESLYKSAQEAINVYKIQIKILESQLSREWANTK